MKRLKILGIVLAAIVWMGVGIVIAKGPQPEIVVPAEVITKAGPINVSNTMITAWVVMIFLIVVTFLGTRAMKLAPSGLQNFLEGVVGFLLDQMADIAGEKNARRFFPVIATMFLFLITSNWMGLLPFFNAIGKTEDVGHEIFHEIAEHAEEGKAFEEDESHAAWFMKKSGGIVYTKPGAKDAEFEFFKDEKPENALDRYVVFLAQKFTDFEPAHAEGEHGAPPGKADVAAAKKALDDTEDAPKLITGRGEGDAHGVLSPALSEEVAGVDFSKSEKLALVVPFFRGVFSDVNNTLAMGLIAFVMIEFWGLQSLRFGYLKKFFNFSGVIPFIVGLLELLSEFIRIISFTFRLFGNIFAGEVLVLMLTFLMPFLLVDIIYGLELFVGFIQAAVFALLTLVFATMAVESHDEHEPEEGGHATPDHHGTAQAH